MNDEMIVTDAEWQRFPLYYEAVFQQEIRMRAMERGVKPHAEKEPEVIECAAIIDPKPKEITAEDILRKKHAARAQRVQLRKQKVWSEQCLKRLIDNAEHAFDRLIVMQAETDFVFDQPRGFATIHHDQPASGRRVYHSCRAAITRILNDYYGSPTMAGAF